MKPRNILLLILAAGTAPSLGLHVNAQPGPGYALSFDSTDYVSISPTGAVSGSFTVEAWVNPGDTNASTIFSTRVPGETTFDIQLNTVGLHGDIGTGVGGAWLTTAADAYFPHTNNQWFHMAYVVTTTNYTIYVNGQQLTNGGYGLAGTPLLYNSTHPDITIGTYFPGGSQFRGQLDEIRVWNVARTQAQIQSNLTARLAGSESGLVDYYRFDEPNEAGVATLVLDSSGHGNHGQLVNRPFRVRSTSPLAETLILNGPNPMTNECHFPFNEPGAGTAPRALAMGQDHVLALRSDGTLIGWGDNLYGESTSPSNATNVVSVAVGDFSSLVLKADGTVLGWGSTGFGEPFIPSSATDVVSLVSGRMDALALKTNGTVVAWGYGLSGETNVPSSATNVTAVAAGYQHCLALRADGTVVAWGLNDHGQTNVPANATNVVGVTAGGDCSFALRADGTVVAWGDNSLRQTNVPPNATNLVALSSSGTVTVGLTADGALIPWGSVTDPLQNIPPGTTNIVSLAMGTDYAFALRGDGTILGWGASSFGISNIPPAINAQTGIYTSGLVNSNQVGVYTPRYSTATNVFGAFAATTRTVFVADTLPPQLVLNGRQQVYQLKGAPYVDAGAVATDLCAGDLTPNIVVSGTVNTSVEGVNVLGYMVTDAYGNVSTTNRTVVVYPMAGDYNGDGTVSRAEFDQVYSNYLMTGASPLRMTNLAGLGSPRVTFALSSLPGSAFSVEYSTNLVDWQYLAPAVPEYLFTDPNAPNSPRRFYRVRWP